MKKKEKICPNCKEMLPYEVFVTSWGEQSNSGRYCRPCHIEREEKQKQAQLQERKELIEKLQIVYGQYWRHYAAPEDFDDSLRQERDFCPYCGTNFKEVLPAKFNDIAMHLDHMDPLHKGGEHSIRNAVYCCGPCNIKKGKISFRTWLEKLEPETQKLAREIYSEKHGHPPEEFVEGCNWGRGSRDTELVPFRSLGDIRSSYPTPIVDGPPSNQPIVITIDVGEQMKKFLEEREKGKR
ncbi:HNH endonuclease [bacterium]|nr:HNH endonuclease [bacterium]